MCGITGFVNGPSHVDTQAVLDSLRHRGPDESGSLEVPAAGAWLGATRLAIQDLPHGQQPMPNEAGTVNVVFNGEIYNAPALRDRLERRGHRFATVNSDTEVLVHLYEEMGDEMVDELNGMFAFVILDADRRRVFGARDRTGIKPLYLARPRGGLAFASELKTLLGVAALEREIDREQLFHYLSLRFVPGPGSILRGVERLPAGHSFTYDIDKGDLRVRRYWRLDFDHHNGIAERDLPGALREQLRAAVQRWTLSDVPIACSLSGGVDSSAVVALMHETGYQGLATYSVGFDDPELSELPLARVVAERYGTEHHEFVLDADALLDDLLAMVWTLDEPYGGGLPSWYVFELMARSVKVAMTGTGGDELFGSYGKFRPFEQSRLARLGAWPGVDSLAARAVARLASHVPGGWVSDRGRRALRDVRSLVREPIRWHYFDRSYYFEDEVKRSTVFADGNGFRDTAHLLQRLFDESGADNPRDAIAYVDFETQLAEEFLLMTDRFSMAHSLEARVPLLDRELVEFVAGIPASLRTRPNDLKWLLKEAVRDLLPPEVLAGAKRGFVIPYGRWLREDLRPLAERLLEPNRLRRQGIFRPEVADLYVRPHLEGRADLAHQVWNLLMFQLWHLLYIEEALTEAPSFDWKAIAA